jgi:hypothetical protein
MRLLLMLLTLIASDAIPPAVVTPEVKPPVVHTYIYVVTPDAQKKMDEEMLRKLYENDQRNPQRQTKLI